MYENSLCSIVMALKFPNIITVYVWYIALCVRLWMPSFKNWSLLSCQWTVCDNLWVTIMSLYNLYFFKLSETSLKDALAKQPSPCTFY